MECPDVSARYPRTWPSIIEECNWSQSKIYQYKLHRKVYDPQIGDTGVLEDGVPPNDLQFVKNNHGGVLMKRYLLWFLHAFLLLTSKLAAQTGTTSLRGNLILTNTCPGRIPKANLEGCGCGFFPNWRLHMRAFSKENSSVCLFFCLLAVLICLLTPVGAWAQAVATGTVHGVVTDPANAVVVGAAVTLTDTSTNAARTATTNQAGRGLFPVVPPAV